MGKQPEEHHPASKPAFSHFFACFSVFFRFRRDFSKYGTSAVGSCSRLLFHRAIAVQKLRLRTAPYFRG
jgi:hypothetical protein